MTWIIATWIMATWIIATWVIAGAGPAGAQTATSPEQPAASQPAASQPSSPQSAAPTPRGQQHGQAHAEQPHTPRAHVYLLRGLFNVFSLGMDTLGEELSKRGVETSVDNYAQWMGLAEQAAARYKAGTENPIILIGHSLGADSVMDMAEALRRKDVPVALVIPFDGTKTLYAPANVARVVNLTQRSYAYARPGPGFHGALTNVDVSFDKEIDHINIDKAARTHARAISEVMAVVGHPSPPPTSPPPKGQQPAVAAKPAATEPAATEDATPTKSSPPEAAPALTAPAATAPAPASGASPVSEPPAHSGVVAPAIAKPPTQDASTGSLPAEKPLPPPVAVPQPAPLAKPGPAKPAARSGSPSIEN